MVVLLSAAPSVTRPRVGWSVCVFVISREAFQLAMELASEFENILVPSYLRNLLLSTDLFISNSCSLGSIFEANKKNLKLAPKVHFNSTPNIRQ